MKYDEIEIGQKAELSHVITADNVSAFILLTGDNNSVHIKDNGIVHGMLTASFISTMIGTILPGDGTIWLSQSFEFIRPVKIGDIITVKAEVWTKKDIGNKITLLTDIYNQNKELIIAGTASVKVPE